MITLGAATVLHAALCYYDNTSWAQMQYQIQ